jgi:adenylate cyclase class 2
MSLELEKKYRLTREQFEELPNSLKEIDAEFLGEDLEENVLFGGGVLDEINAIVRLRKTGDKTMLTFKKRIQNQFDIKQQIEHETEVADFSATEKIIESLGFCRRLVYEKKRRSFRVQNALVTLDELPFGFFMEIEGKITEIALAEQLLEAENFETEHETYPRLTAKLGKRNGDVIEARF